MEPMQVDPVDPLNLEQNDNAEAAASAAFVAINNMEEISTAGASPLVFNTSLDLDAYAATYRGVARQQRLQFVAEHCPPLRAEALRLLLRYLQSETLDHNAYQETFRRLVVIQQQHPHSGNGSGAGAATSSIPDAVMSAAGAGMSGFPQPDQVWIDQARRKGQIQLEKLDSDLKNYKSNSIKESIRRGHEDLAEHYLSMGDLQNALKNFSRAREYCTTKNELSACLNVIRVSIYLRNWQHTRSHVHKAEASAELVGAFGVDSSTIATGSQQQQQQQQRPLDEEKISSIRARLHCAAGLADLAEARFKSSARSFLLVNFDHCHLPELLSAANVATYGGLCALATFSRQELKKMIASASFRQFMGVEPQIRDLVHHFYHSEYAACLALLQRLRDHLLLDLYLAPHVDHLYCEIRSRALAQYFSPYMSADLAAMSNAFNCSVSDLENELMQLILQEHIQARIDSHNKVMFATSTDARCAIFEKVLNMSRDYIKRTKVMILHAAVIKANLIVKEGQQVGGNLGATIGGAGTSSRDDNELAMAMDYELSGGKI